VQGEEGLVVKDLSSVYVVGEQSRSKAHWVKMKPEYSDQTSNLDLLVLGGYYGDGHRRAGMLSHFLLGVADHTTMPPDGSVNTTKWFTVGKVLLFFLVFNATFFLSFFLSFLGCGLLALGILIWRLSGG